MNSARGRPDRLRDRCRLGVYGARLAVLPLHDEQLRVDAVALLVEADAPAGEERGRPVSDVHGPDRVGYRIAIGLTRGLETEERALLVRSEHGSPYGDWPVQYEVPRAVQVGEPEVVFMKGEPAGLALDFAALEDPDASAEAERFGRLVAQNTEAGT